MSGQASMAAYWQAHGDKLIRALTEHLEIVGWTLLFSVILASLITLAVMPFRRGAKTTVNLLGAMYSIPSLALFAVLIPVLGIGKVTAIVVLTMYNQFLLVRNFITGFEQVDPALIEAASAMGMTRRQTLIRVKLPLAFPALMAGVRLAVISTIDIAVIAATINAGGIGAILFDGLRTRNTAKLLWGALESAALVIAANFVLSGVQTLVERGFSPGAPRKLRKFGPRREL